MAASGGKNHGSSPMPFVEETLDETRESLDKKKIKHLEEQKVKAPYLVGSIAEVNKRVSKLDRKLQSYTALVVESRSSDNADYNYFMHLQDEDRTQGYEKRVREIQEVNQFAGIYAIKSTFLTKPSERAKHISQISMSPTKSQVKKADTGKPKFVELHQFPGYDPKELTELPFNVSPRDVLRKVAEAQTKLHRTSSSKYMPEFERLFYSAMSEAIVQDVFWFIFLEKWTPNRLAQQGLFNRVAHNYVKLLLYAKHPAYRETFLKDYPSFLAQAIYVAYCEAFPDSYRQFDDQFKEDLVNLVYEWVAGLRPAPRTWSKWNMDKLEPANIKMREELLNQSKNKKSTTSSILDFSFLEQSPSHISGSMSTLNHVGSTSSFSSHMGKKNKRLKGPGLKRNSVFKKNSHDVMSTASGSQGGFTGEVVKAQDGESMKGDESSRRGGTSLAGAGFTTRRSKATINMAGTERGGGAGNETIREEDEEDRKDPLTPIREFDEDDHKSLGMAKSYASFIAKTKSKPKESHTIGRGPEFTRNAFNTFGKSPLVAQYLRMQNLQREAGVNVRVQRTEIEKLPPVDGKTYADLTRQSYKRVRNLSKEYQKRCDQEMKERKEFVMQQKAVLNEYMRKEGALLAQKREVKRLSDLIMLEINKDPDSVSANAMQALEQALLAQEV